MQTGDGDYSHSNNNDNIELCSIAPEITTTMGNSQYATIPEQEGLVGGGAHNSSDQRRRFSFSSGAAILLVVSAAILGAVALLNSHSSSSDVSFMNEVPIEGLSKKGSSARACKFEECYESNCNAAVAPFICITHNGGPHMGCSPVAWSAFTCDDQCDLSGCDSLDIPDDTEGCAGQECGKQWCAGGQVCHIDVPYQCTEGSARFGCSTDEYQWSLKVDDATCSKCCDMASC